MSRFSQSKDIRGYVSRYIPKSELKSSTSGLALNNQDIINEIRIFDPLFSERDLLLQALDDARTKARLKNSIAKKLYDIMSKYQSHIEFSVRVGNIYLILPDNFNKLEQLKALFGSDMVGAPPEYEYEVVTGPGHKIKNLEQFMNDLYDLQGIDRTNYRHQDGIYFAG